MSLLLLGCGEDRSTSSVDPATTSAGIDWLEDFEAAKSEAGQTQRLVLANFTGSDWCPPCVQMKKDVFSTKPFARYAADELVLLELDFPQRSAQSQELERQNKALAAEYGVAGFPTLLLLDPNGKEVARSVGYLPGGPEGFVSWVEASRSR